MQANPKTYTVSRLARLAGVSVRTLHYYDQVGLLKPSAQTAAGYRLYGEADLLRLQQILLFKELDFSLADIRRALDDPGFDPVQALQRHRRLLEERRLRLERLLHTIDRTLATLTEDHMTLTDEELYEGFTKEQIERYPRQAAEMYDPALVKLANERVRKMSKAQWAAVKAEGDQVTRSLAGLMGRDPADPQVQALIARHYAWVEHFYPVSAEIYRGLGQLYTSHPEFRATYDRYAKDLADFMQAAMEVYARQALDGV
jgi:DNA-binding transcriptional MerR regulator